jgi:uncharacterized protein YggE/uncharacterized membrane protein YdjX (TVP38/TMEM64 family)
MTAHHGLQRHIIIVGILLILVGLAAGTDSLHECSESLIEWSEGVIAAAPVTGMAVFVLLAMLSAMLAFFSSAVVAPIAIHAWGQGPTLALLWLGWFLGGLLSFCIGRFLGRSVATAIVGEEKLSHWSRELGERARFIHVVLFQAFVPSEIPGYVLGTLHYRLSWYVAALAITELPYAVVTVYLGESYLRGNSLIFIALGLLVVIAALAAYRFIRKRQHAGGSLKATAPVSISLSRERLCQRKVQRKSLPPGSHIVGKVFPMQQIRIAASLLLLLISVIASGAEPVRVVTVDGQGTVSASPDMARVSMGVQARNIDIGVAREQVIDVSDRFLKLCDRLGIDKSRIQTTGLSIFPEYRWNEDRKQQELQAYRVSRRLEVEVRDLDDLGQLMEGAVSAGVNEVSPPELISSTERDLHRQALAAAARDARANAELLAETLGVRLGNVIEISSSQNMVQPPVVRAESMAMAARADAPQTYNAGEIRFQASVQASFEILVP